MFGPNGKNLTEEKSATPSAATRLREERGYHQQVRKLYQQTHKTITRLQKRQVRSQRLAVANMTRAFESLVTRTTEMVGFMIGTMLAGGEISGKSFFANFLDLLGQFSVMLGTVAIASSQVLGALFSGNPAALLAGGLALVAVGGVIKAFASELKSSGGQLGSGAGLVGSTPLGGGAATGASSLAPTRESSDEASKQTVYYYHFEGGLYDERGLARIAATSLNKHAGRTAPLLRRRAMENG